METLLRMVWIEPAYAACLKLGVDVGLFAALGEKGEGREYSVEELAGKTGVERDLLGMLPFVGIGCFVSFLDCMKLTERL